MRTNTCNAMVYGESGRFPVAIMIKMMIGYWGRLLTGKSTKLVKLIYNCVNRQDNSIQFKWLTNNQANIK